MLNFEILVHTKILFSSRTEEKKEEIWLRRITKPLHPQKNPKSNVTTQKPHQKRRLHND